MSKKDITESVTIELPKAIMDFLRSVEVNPQEYLQYSLLAVIKADLESTSGIWGFSAIVKRYGLEHVFKTMKTTD